MDLQRENDGIVEIAGRKVRYIDPLTDWGFKRLFGTEVNKEFCWDSSRICFRRKGLRISHI